MKYTRARGFLVFYLSLLTPSTFPVMAFFLAHTAHQQQQLLP